MKSKNNFFLIKKFSCINSLAQFSKNAKVFVLVHKMDLVPDDRKVEVFESRKKQLEEKAAGKFKIECFATSIWEISLYKAWTSIVSSLTLNREEIKNSLKNYAEACEADEVILFEKNTFLLTSSYSSRENNDDQRFEKISHIIKKFKLSCMSSNSSFQSMVIQTKNFTAYLDEFTSSTYIMVVLSNKNVNLELIKLNTALCRQSFEEKLSKKN